MKKTAVESRVEEREGHDLWPAQRQLVPAMIEELRKETE